jgi:cytochrome b561
MVGTGYATAILAGLNRIVFQGSGEPLPENFAVYPTFIAHGYIALFLAGFIVRMLTSRPAPATTGHPFLDRIAPVTHYGFYVLVLLMVAPGYATAILAGLNRIVFQGSGEPLPENFAVYPTFIAHGYIALFLAGFVVLHVLAALYHQFVRRDGLFRRMWFGRRAAKAVAPAE